MPPLTKQIPEKDIPDNGPQQGIFEEMIVRGRPARVYLIRDRRAGCGKTLLLRKLHWACRQHRKLPPRIVACAVDLEDHAGPTAYSLVSALADQLGRDALPEFDRLQVALELKDPAPFVPQPRTRERSDAASLIPDPLVGRVDAAGAEVRDHAQVGGIIINTQAPTYLHVPERARPQWQEELRPRAERAIVNAFFEDLRGVGDDRLMVIFIDSVDAKAQYQELVHWVLDTLLTSVFLEPDQRPKNAILCLAGRDLPDNGYLRLPGDDAADWIEAPTLLTAWQPEHTGDFLRLMLGREPSQDMLDFAHNRIISKAVPLRKIYEGAKAFEPDDDHG